MVQAEEIFEGQFYFDPDDPIYRDHFPGYAVVPGSLIVHAFMQTVQDRAAVLAPWSIKDFRFKRFIAPGRYAFRIETRSDGRLNCRLYDQDAVVVTGIL